MPHLWPTGSSWGRPLDYGPVLLRKPFGPHLAMGALSSAVPSWRLQVRLGCVRLSPACPFRRLHTCHLRPARHYPRLWIRPPSSGGRRDFNPPNQCAAWRTLCPLLTSAPRSRALRTRSVRDCRTRRRPPEVRPIAFTAHPPDLPPRPLMAADFAISRSLVRPGRPRIRFLFIGSRLCSTLPSDPASRRRPCASLILRRHRLDRGLAPPSYRSCSAHAKDARSALTRRPSRSYPPPTSAASHRTPAPEAESAGQFGAAPSPSPPLVDPPNRLQFHPHLF